MVAAVVDVIAIAVVVVVKKESPREREGDNVISII